MFFSPFSVQVQSSPFVGAFLSRFLGLVLLLQYKSTVQSLAVGTNTDPITVHASEIMQHLRNPKNHSLINFQIKHNKKSKQRWTFIMNLHTFFSRNSNYQIHNPTKKGRTQQHQFQPYTPKLNSHIIDSDSESQHQPNRTESESEEKNKPNQSQIQTGLASIGPSWPCFKHQQ